MSSNLRLRVLSALILIPAAYGLFYVGGGWLVAVLGLIAVVMMHEWTSMTEGEAVWPLLLLEVMALVGALLMTGFGHPMKAVLFSLVAAVLVGFAAWMMTRRPLWAMLGMLYVIIPCVSLLSLRSEPGHGFGWTLWVLVIVWATDIGGYAAGKSIGGPKLAPRISPNKTWAGLLGGMALAAIASFGIGAGFALPVSGIGLLLTGAGLAVWAQLGDLVESAVKRHFGVKDSGSLIPGHGGILDRVDGLVFVAPVVAFAIATL
ncbi:phosphatidate cytidylyltransferase [Govanella unica]|uniref:Phosphatidate cytidylyltransferase n=1 Tax=Govanella unica TaxID=2975056 RepID=A0A9X3Z742_9PROT|nr:phosphatidate cytidylyltransferase [Govania unica]MDA5193771.1 phosphatidate cytidylyltransferase [Govania unica]